MAAVRKQQAAPTAGNLSDTHALTLADALDLLPHGPELYLLARVNRSEAGAIDCESLRNFPEWMRSAEDELSPASLIELSAQAASVGRILAIAQDGDRRPRKGAVVRLRSFSLPQVLRESDLPLQVQARWSSAVSGAYEVEANILSPASGELLAQGRLTIVEFQ